MNKLYCNDFISPFSMFRYKRCPSTNICSDGDFKRISHRTGGCNFTAFVLNDSETRRPRGQSRCVLQARVNRDLFRRYFSSCLWTSKASPRLYLAPTHFSAYFIIYLVFFFDNSVSDLRPTNLGTNPNMFGMLLLV